MIFNINSTRGQTRFLTCVARVTCLVRNKRSTKLGAVHVLLKPAHNSAQLRCFENGNDDFGREAFWIGDAARVGYFVPLNGPLNGHSPSYIKEKGLSREEMYDHANGGVCHRTSTPNKSGNMIKRKKKKKFPLSTGFISFVISFFL